MYVPLFVALAFNMITYCGTKLLVLHRVPADWTLDIDSRTPLVPWMVGIYLICYLFWGVNYCLGCEQDREEAFRFLSAEFLAKFICLLCFIFIPTTLVRPEITGTSFWESILRFVYWIDSPKNLFPSIHCLVSCFCVIAIRKNDKIPRIYRCFSELFALSIYISTLTTKQHVLVDVVAGVALAEFSYWFVHRIGFDRLYGRVMEHFIRKINKNVKDL